MGDRNPVGVSGSGTMGHGIAQLLATRGKKVFLVDTSRASLQTGEMQIRDNLSYMTKIGCLSFFEAEATAARIAYSTELKDLVSQARYITEAVSENLELKKDLFDPAGHDLPAAAGESAKRRVSVHR